MIQELLGGASSSFIEGERKISINEGILSTPFPTSLLSSPSPASFTPSVTTPSITAATAAAATTSKNQNLRCPRCDSSNTKFCYYNNYNLTQPRHFCKTCRRYWTKGGALRNVPIGGGCRKNRSTGMSNTVAGASVTKMKAAASELGRVFDHDLPQSPILWGSPQNTHLLAFLRARQSQNQNRNPNPNPNPIVSGVTVKEEGNLRSQPHMGTEPLFANGALNPRIYDATVGQVPSHSLGMCSSFWRNNEDQIQQTNNGFVLGEHQSSGIQELHHKLRSSSSVSYCIDNSPIILGNMASTSSLSNILEPSLVSGTEFGCWNPTLSWSDIPTTNGPYP